MDIKKHLHKDNLHHAYLIEGNRDEIIPEVLSLLKDMGIHAVQNNGDLIQLSMDSFKMEDSRQLRTLSMEKGITSEKKIFILSTNQILLEAQNSLLKIFEEPIDNTHFFIVVPDASSLIKTFVSRFYFISARGESTGDIKEAEKFLTMPAQKRIDFIKNLLTVEESEDEEGNEVVPLNSNRSKALVFLNALESVLHKQLVLKPVADSGFFEHIFKVRKFLRMPGSSAKSLMESLALVIPDFEN